MEMKIENFFLLPNRCDSDIFQRFEHLITIIMPDSPVARVHRRETDVRMSSIPSSFEPSSVSLVASSCIAPNLVAHCSTKSSGLLIRNVRNVQEPGFASLFEQVEMIVSSPRVVARRRSTSLIVHRVLTMM